MSRKKRVLFCSEFSQLNTGYATYTREILNELNKTDRYELAELASYGQRNDPRIANIPWKVYGVMPNTDCEPKASEEELRVYNSSPTNQFGEWIFEHVCLDYKPDVVCMPPKTPIATENGYKFIHEVNVGEKVLTHKGRYKKVIKTMRKEHRGDMIKIKANGDSHYMSLTEDHPVLVYKKRNQTNQKKSMKKIYDKIEPEFIPSKNVKTGDLLVFPRCNSQRSQEKIDITKYLVNYLSENDKIFPSIQANCSKINRFIPINYDFSKLCGYIIGDGYISDSGVIISFQGNEMEFALECQQIFTNIFDLHSSVDIVKDRYMINVTCNSVLMSEFFKLFVGPLTRSKFIPRELRFGSKNVKEGLISGLIRSDGCYKQNTVSFCTVSEKLAYEYMQLCIDVGIPVNITYNKSNNSYDISGYGQSAIDLHDISNKYDNHIETFGTNQLRKPRSTQMINGYMVASVQRVRKESYNGLVYNLEVKDDNSYVSNWCVHNCDIRDFWMCNHIAESPYRNHFNFALMPTVDAKPQAREWVAAYEKADAILTYSAWAGGILEDQSGGKINYLGRASPSAHPAYKPVEDKAAHKKEMGIDPTYKVIGTVMRNQRRKLFPDLFAAFREYLNNTGDKTYLYCHTSYPDLGWDIPELLQEHNLSSHVLFTYICPETKKPFPALFKGAMAQSPYTGKWGATLSNVKHGLSYEDLAKVMNCFDLYVQYANCEGFGMPQLEAAACAVPVMATDYSAMESVVRKINGFPIKPKALYKELETGCMRAVPDNELAASMFARFFDKTDEEQKECGLQARKGFEDKYQWDIASKKWSDYVDSVDIRPEEETWKSPPRIHTPAAKPEQIPPNTNHNQLAKWLIVNVLGDPTKLNSFFEARLTRDLMYKSTTANVGGMYFNESSAAFTGNNQRQAFDFDMAYNKMAHMCQHRNQWEQKRAQMMGVQA